jgi:hypothetical protein
MTLLIILLCLDIFLIAVALQCAQDIPPPPPAIPRAGRVPAEFLTGEWETTDGRMY